MINYNGTTASVSYIMNSGFTMDEAQLYVGNEPLARDVNDEYIVAPGQYPIVEDDLNGATTATYTVNVSGDIHVVVHAVVCGNY